MFPGQLIEFLKRKKAETALFLCICFVVALSFFVLGGLPNQRKEWRAEATPEKLQYIYKVFAENAKMENIVDPETGKINPTLFDIELKEKRLVHNYLKYTDGSEVGQVRAAFYWDQYLHVFTDKNKEVVFRSDDLVMTPVAETDFNLCDITSLMKKNNFIYITCAGKILYKINVEGKSPDQLISSFEMTSETNYADIFMDTDIQFAEYDPSSLVTYFSYGDKAVFKRGDITQEMNLADIFLVDKIDAVAVMDGYWYVFSEVNFFQPYCVDSDEYGEGDFKEEYFDKEVFNASFEEEKWRLENEDIPFNQVRVKYRTALEAGPKSFDKRKTYINVTKKGTVSGILRNGETYTLSDYCLDESTLVEYYCSNNIPKKIQRGSTSDAFMYCKDGSYDLEGPGLDAWGNPQPSNYPFSAEYILAKTRYSDYDDYESSHYVVGFKGLFNGLYYEVFDSCQGEFTNNWKKTYIAVGSIFDIATEQQKVMLGTNEKNYWYYGYVPVLVQADCNARLQNYYAGTGKDLGEYAICSEYNFFPGSVPHYLGRVDPFAYISYNDGKDCAFTTESEGNGDHMSDIAYMICEADCDYGNYIKWWRSQNPTPGNNYGIYQGCIQECMERLGNGEKKDSDVHWTDPDPSTNSRDFMADCSKKYCDTQSSSECFSRIDGSHISYDDGCLAEDSRSLAVCSIEDACENGKKNKDYKEFSCSYGDGITEGPFSEEFFCTNDLNRDLQSFYERLNEYLKNINQEEAWNLVVNILKDYGMEWPEGLDMKIDSGGFENLEGYAAWYDYDKAEMVINDFLLKESINNTLLQPEYADGYEATPQSKTRKAFELYFMLANQGGEENIKNVHGVFVDLILEELNVISAINHEIKHFYDMGGDTWYGRSIAWWQNSLNEKFLERSAYSAGDDSVLNYKYQAISNSAYWNIDQNLLSGKIFDLRKRGMNGYFNYFYKDRNGPSRSSLEKELRNIKNTPVDQKFYEKLKEFYYNQYPDLFDARISADLNNDRKVDVSDVGIMMSYWGTKGESPADKNRDGMVDVGDAGILMSQYVGK